jgi:hypothetical protein
MVTGEVYQLESAVENWAGSIAKNAHVIEVQRLQPASPGSLFFFQTDDTISMNIEHIISGKLVLELAPSTTT